jgi:hypothetical protein
MLFYLENTPLAIRGKIWMQHDGEPSYFGRQVTGYLNENYQGRRIKIYGKVAWPPRYPDFNLPDFFLWG